MSNTATIVELFPEDLKDISVTDRDKLERFWDEEADRYDEMGIEPTIGEIIGLLMKGAIRALIGDELYFTNLEETCETDEDIMTVMNRVKEVLQERIQEWDDEEAEDAADETETE